MSSRAVCKQNEGKRKTGQRIQSKTETDLKIGVPKYSYIDLAKSQSGAPRPGHESDGGQAGERWYCIQTKRRKKADLQT